MGVTTASPNEVFIGAPGQVKFGGLDVGATTEGVTIRIVPGSIFTPQVNGVPGMLAKTDYLVTEEVEAEVTMLELSKANLLKILAGATEAPANTITRTLRRYPSAMYADLIIALQGLDTEALVFYFPNVTPTSGLEVTATDDGAAAPAVTFSGRYRFGDDFWRIVRKAAATRLEWLVAPLATLSLTQNLAGQRYAVRAINYDGKPVTYTMTNVPAGMVFDNASGTLSGTPTTVGALPASVFTAIDGVNTNVTGNTVITIVAP